ICNADKLRIVLQALKILGSTIPHAGTKSANKLEHGIGQRTFVWHTTFDSFRHKLAFVLLEVTILTSVLHRAKRSHAAINFISASLENFRLAWALLCTCKQAADHNRIRS